MKETTKKGENKMKTTINTPQTIETIRTKTGTYLCIQTEDGNWVEIHLNVENANDLIGKVQHDIKNIVQ